MGIAHLSHTINVVGLVAAVAFSGAARAAEPLKVSAHVVTTGKPYAGQAVEIRVDVQGVEGPAEVAPPRLAEVDGELHRLSPERFVVVARRPGTLVIPPFRANSGDRSGASRPIRLSIENVPLSGRSTAFLGGVGPFEIRAEADPPRLRLGQSMEYRIAMNGQAAWGSDRPPELGEAKSAIPGLRVEPIPGRLEGGDPAIRTFRYRLRPGRAGRWVLPPLTVAAFDPKTGRYATRVAPGVPIEVEDIPRFDPARLDYGAGRSMAEPETPRAWWWFGITLGIVLSVAVGGFFWRRARSSRRPDPRRIALDLARGLGEGADEAEMARRVVEAMAAFLQEVGGRSPGVLTPPEARADVERLTLDRDLARGAERLVEDCDRARFGGVGEGADRLMARGRAILEQLGDSAEWKGEEGGPREAVGTAKV